MRHRLVYCAIVLITAGCGEERLRQVKNDPFMVCVDADGDGVDSCADCNDSNPYVRPGIQELCNGADDDCDGTPDNACAQLSNAALFHTFSSGGSYGASAMTSGSHKNQGTLGEATPPNDDHSVMQASATHLHYGGFSAVLRR